jgi:hypothetical protein
VYIDPAGNVSTDFLEGSAANFGVIGSKVVFDGDNDRFVINVDNRIVVIRRDGNVFAHAVRQILLLPTATRPLTILPPVACSGSKVASNGDADRFVTRLFSRRIIVVRQDGTVSSHNTDAVNRIISPPFAFSGSKIASNSADDQFVVAMGVTNDFTGSSS